MEKYIERLNSVYNTLAMIETKGQSTVYMGACLSIMKEVLEEAVSEIQSRTATTDSKL